MEKKYFYIEPAALHLYGDSHISTDQMLHFLDEFEELLCAVGSSQCKFIIDNIIGKSLIDRSGEFLIPAKISEIDDNQLRARVNKLQQGFSSIVNPLISVIDTEACSIENDNVCISPCENEKLFQLEYYLDFFHSILGECYRKKISSNDILVIPAVSQIKGNLLQIKCGCDVNDIEKELNCVSYNILINRKDAAIKDLKNLLRNINAVSQGDIKVVQAEHEGVIANTIIRKYNQIPSYLRRVWDIFLLFGMFQIDIREWKNQKAKQGMKGSIQKCNIIKCGIKKEPDIIEGWWRADDRPFKVYMYFPSGMANYLITILGESFNFSDVVTLKDTVL